MSFATYFTIKEDGYVMVPLGDGFNSLLPSNFVLLARDTTKPADNACFTLNLYEKEGIHDGNRCFAIGA